MTRLVLMRELKARITSRGFVASTAIMLVVVVAGALAVTFLGGDDGARQVRVGLSSAGAFAGDPDAYEATKSALDTPEVDIDPVVVITDDPATSLETGEIEAHFDGQTIRWSNRVDLILDQSIRQRLSQVELAQRADDLELGPAQLAELFGPIEYDEILMSGEDPDQMGMRFVAAAVAAFSLFILIQGWGAQIMMGVIEEKQSRVIEILLAQLRPRDLLAGKVFGIGMLALIQMLVLIGGLALVLALATGIDVPTGVWVTLPLTLATFLLGFAFYGSAFAAVGAMATRTEDVQSAQLPAMLPLMAGYVIAAASLANPVNLAVNIGTFIPFTSPILLPFRNAHGSLPGYWIAASLLILAVSTWFMLQLGEWVYRRSLLRVGNRVSVRDLWQTRHQSADFE